MINDHTERIEVPDLHRSSQPLTLSNFPDRPTSMAVRQLLTFYHVVIYCGNLSKVGFKFAIDMANGSQMCGYRPVTDQLIVRFVNHGGCDTYIGKLKALLKDDLYYEITKEVKCQQCWTDASRFPMYSHLCDHP